MYHVEVLSLRPQRSVVGEGKLRGLTFGPHHEMLSLTSRSSQLDSLTSKVLSAFSPLTEPC